MPAPTASRLQRGQDASAYRVEAAVEGTKLTMVQLKNGCETIHTLDTAVVPRVGGATTTGQQAAKPSVYQQHCHWTDWLQARERYTLVAGQHSSYIIIFNYGTLYYY